MQQRKRRLPCFPRSTVRSKTELYKALDLLGAKSDLLGIVGSWGDTQDDEWVLTELRAWNERQEPTKGGFED